MTKPPLCALDETKDFGPQHLRSFPLLKGKPL
jgi:hypothetical protein